MANLSSAALVVALVCRAHCSLWVWCVTVKNQVRSGQWCRIPKSGFVESGRAPALSKLTSAGPICETRMGLPEQGFFLGVCFLGGWGGGLSLHMSLWKPFQSMCNSGVREKNTVLVEMFMIQGIVMVVSQTILVITKSSLYPPGILMLYTKRDFFFLKP